MVDEGGLGPSQQTVNVTDGVTFAITSTRASSANWWIGGLRPNQTGREDRGLTAVQEQMRQAGHPLGRRDGTIWTDIAGGGGDGDFTCGGALWTHDKRAGGAFPL